MFVAHTHTCPKLIQMLLKASWLIHFFGEGCIWALRNAHQKLQIINVSLQWGEDKLHVIGISINPRKGLSEGLGEACQLFPGQGTKEAAGLFPAWTWFQPWSYLRAMVVTGGAVSLTWILSNLSDILTLNSCYLDWKRSPSPNLLLQWGHWEQPVQHCPVGIWMSPQLEIPQPLWGACSSVGPFSWSKRIFLCPDGISCVCLCLIPSHQVLGHIDMIAEFLSWLSSPCSLKLSSHERCSSAFTLLWSFAGFSPVNPYFVQGEPTFIYTPPGVASLVLGREAGSPPSHPSVSSEKEWNCAFHLQSW